MKQTLLLLAALGVSLCLRAAEEPPLEWINVDTGHRVVGLDMSSHDYRLEPNIHFTPDMKWIVFRSNMYGAVHVYAVEIAKPSAQ